VQAGDGQLVDRQQRFFAFRQPEPILARGQAESRVESPPRRPRHRCRSCEMCAAGQGHRHHRRIVAVQHLHAVPAKMRALAAA
jgi:hypothetical protein